MGALDMSVILIEHGAMLTHDGETLVETWPG